VGIKVVLSHSEPFIRSTWGYVGSVNLVSKCMAKRFLTLLKLFELNFNLIIRNTYCPRAVWNILYESDYSIPLIHLMFYFLINAAKTVPGIDGSTGFIRRLTRWEFETLAQKQILPPRFPATITRLNMALELSSKMILIPISPSDYVCCVTNLRDKQ
jgi:hypothetical protein